MTIFPDLTALAPQSATIETESGRATLTGGGPFRHEDIAVAVEGGRVRLTAAHTGVRFVKLRWAAELPAGCRFLGDAWERGYGDFEWRGFVFDRVMPWYFFALAGDTLAGYGVKTRPDAMCSFTCDPHGVTLHLDVRSGSDPVQPGGSTLTLCELVCGEYDAADLLAAQRAFLRRLATGAVFPAKKVYGFNNWYYAYGNSSREEILGNAAHLARLTKGLANRPFMVVDDGWQQLRCDGYIGGPWQGKPEYGDMKTLADEMAAMDVIPGVWFRPLQNRASALTADMYLNREENILDPSRQDVLDWIAQDVKTLCDWGYKLIKYDYSTNDLTGRWGMEMGVDFCGGHIHFADKTKTTARIIKELYRTIYEAAAGKAEILGCNCVGHLGVGYMHLNRTGDDTSGREFARTRRMGVNTLAFRMPQHGIFYDVDADCVGITEHIPWEQNEQWLKLLALSGTPLFVSVAPDLPTEEQNGTIARYLAAASGLTDIAVPMDVLDNTTPEQWRIAGETIRFRF